MNRLKHGWDVAWISAKLSLQRQLEYPSFLVSWFLMIPIQYFSGIWMLHVIVERFQPLSGWSFHQLCFLYGIALLSHGLQVTFFIPTWQIEWMVTQGQFDRMIVRPMGILFQLLTRVVNLIGAIDLIPGTVIFLYGWARLNLPVTLGNILWLGITVIGATFLRAGLYLLTNSLAFWTMRSGALSGLMLELQQRGSLYPLSFYPQALQWFFSLLIPIGFISFYPAADWLQVQTSRPLPVGISVLTPVLGAFVFWIGLKVFNGGLKRYESTGS